MNDPILMVTTAHPTMFHHGLNGALHPNLGRLIQPRHTSSIDKTAECGIAWAADNDCFQGLNADKYLAMLDKIEGLQGAKFVTVPDVVADADTTMKLFDKWQPIVASYGLPPALVLQDGCEKHETPWDLIDALFIGGSTEFKLGPVAAEYAREAADRGKWVHWGRVNTRKRFDYIMSTGAAHSFDGSKFARWRKTYLNEGLTWTVGAGLAAA
jgi:hypothetical protein